MRKHKSFYVTDSGNCRAARTGDVFVTVLGPRQWDDAEWDDFLKLCDVAAYPAGLPPAPVSITYMFGPVPTPKQRRLSAERSRDDIRKMKRLALITNSAVVRGVLTAFSWLLPGPKMRAFGPEDLEASLRWLAEVVELNPDKVRALFNDMVDDVGMK